jgi:hypothetical protein
LPFQIRDLLFVLRNLLLRVRDLLLAFGNLLLRIRDLLVALGYLATQFLILAQQPLVFPMQLLTARLGNALMPLRRCPLSLRGLSRAGTH